MDVRPIDCSHDSEVERQIGLGARRADVGQGTRPWVVLADPEGNEFCLQWETGLAVGQHGEGIYFL